MNRPEQYQPRPEQTRRLTLPETRDDVEERARLVLESYGLRTLEVLGGMVRRGEGREVIATVRDRPEDEQLGIDAYGEHILTGLVRDFNLPAIIKGEHNNYRSENMNELKPGAPYAVFAIDSFDNSSQYKRDLDTPPYTAVSGFLHYLPSEDEAGEVIPSPEDSQDPIGSVIGDIKDRRVYMIDMLGYSVVRDLDTGQEKRVFKSDVTDIRSPRFTLAVYLGSNEYSLSFFRHFEHLLEGMDPRAILYAGGGAYIPAIVGRGAATAYMMLREPRTETDAGAAFALAADLDVVTVNLQTFKITPYRFDESRHDERDDFFIMANNRQITEQLIEEYKIGEQRLQERDAAWKIWSFLQTRPDLARLVEQAIASYSSGEHKSPEMS